MAQPWSRFTSSSSAVAPLQERLAPGGPARQPAVKPFGRSSATFGRSQTGQPLDRSATLKKLESLRAVASHAQAAELSHAISTWAEAAQLVREPQPPSSQRAPPPVAAAALPPPSPMAPLASPGHPASGLMRQAATGRRTLRLLESLRAVVQHAEQGQLEACFEAWHTLPTTWAAEEEASATSPPHAPPPAAQQPALPKLVLPARLNLSLLSHGQESDRAPTARMGGDSARDSARGDTTPRGGDGDSTPRGGNGDATPRGGGDTARSSNGEMTPRGGFGDAAFVRSTAEQHGGNAAAAAAAAAREAVESARGRSADWTSIHGSSVHGSSIHGRAGAIEISSSSSSYHGGGFGAMGAMGGGDGDAECGAALVSVAMSDLTTLMNSVKELRSHRRQLMTDGRAAALRRAVHAMTSGGLAHVLATWRRAGVAHAAEDRLDEARGAASAARRAHAAEADTLRGRADSLGAETMRIHSELDAAVRQVCGCMPYGPHPPLPLVPRRVLTPPPSVRRGRWTRSRGRSDGSRRRLTS